MKTWVLTLLVVLGTALSLCAQTAAPSPAPVSAATTSEAQAVVDALSQSKDHVWSIYLLGMAQLIAALATLCLLFNLRSLAFLFLVFYGTVILSVPYYIPNAFQSTFGISIVILAFIGLLSRLLMIKPKARQTDPADAPGAAQGAENHSQAS